MIEYGLPGARASVDGDGTHFQATVVYDGFTSQSLLQRHRMVYATLGAKMGREIHALSIRALTSAEWDAQKDLGTLQ